MTKRCTISDNDCHDINFLLPGGGDPDGGGVDAAVGSVASDEVTGMPPATAAASMMALPLRVINSVETFGYCPLMKPTTYVPYTLLFHSPVRGPVTRCSCD